MIKKIDKIRDLLIVPSVGEKTKLAINQRKILNLLVELRAEAEQLTIPDFVGRSEQLFCDVCGSNDVIEAPHMGYNCNRCNPL